MSDEAYRKLAKVLDTLPNGFPQTESGVEIKLLKKIFRPEDIDLFCELRLTFEATQQIAKRTGRPIEGLEDKLNLMQERGQIMGVQVGPVKLFKMLPWVIGIYEMQLHRMDREFVEMVEEYAETFSQTLFATTPQIMQVIPVEQEIPFSQEALPYERVSAIVEKGKSFAVSDCICKKEQKMLDNGCNKPQEVCLAIAPVPNAFENSPWRRLISKEEAYSVLRRAEEEALVHMSSNVQNGQHFICNCCGCCCGVLRSINELNILNATNSHYYAEIDTDVCIGCGVCADERCQVHAIQVWDEYSTVNKEKCIGCGLCVSTCPTEAVKLVPKQPEEWTIPPKDEMTWFDEKARVRGVDFSRFK